MARDQIEELGVRPWLGCVADDVTGATDLASNLVAGGMHVVQWLDEPSYEELCAESCQAVVLAQKTRALPSDQAVALSLTAVSALRRLGCQRFFFKYCSTFDSTERGNIGPVADALMDYLEVAQTIFTPAFPRNGRTVYQGHLFVHDRLLNESGMQYHPLNPMSDADIVRLLRQQTSGKVGLLPYAFISAGQQRVREQLIQLSQQGFTHIVCDCLDDFHLQTLAAAVTDMPLLTGGSGIARFLPDGYREAGLLPAEAQHAAPPAVSGRSAILSGSCSAATNRQVAAVRSQCATWMVDVRQIVRDKGGELVKLIEWAKTVDPQQTLMVSSTAEPDLVHRYQQQYGREQVAAAIEDFHATVASHLESRFGVRRFIIAGGETAGAVVRGMNVRGLRIGAEICSGVPWTTTIGPHPRALALKSGNFGDDEFFVTALAMLP